MITFTLGVCLATLVAIELAKVVRKYKRTIPVLRIRSIRILVVTESEFNKLEYAYSNVDQIRKLESENERLYKRIRGIESALKAK